MNGWSRASVVGLAVTAMTVASACQSLPSLPANPFQPAATATPARDSAGGPAGKPSEKPSADGSTEAFSPFWVKNHQITEMWSERAGEPTAISFGTTSSQFCVFQVVRPPDNPRLYIRNPYSDNFFWIDADAVGPVELAPERRQEPKPADQNCSEVIYEG